ncbi:hypothetical protein [Oculatella sp. LEGE 06141]|nr:hypothetical protein [Oculatella sp. LEGE 06141]
MDQCLAGQVEQIRERFVRERLAQTCPCAGMGFLARFAVTQVPVE